MLSRKNSVCNDTHDVILEIFVAKGTHKIKFTSKTIKAFKRSVLNIYQCCVSRMILVQTYKLANGLPPVS